MRIFNSDGGAPDRETRRRREKQWQLLEKVMPRLTASDRKQFSGMVEEVIRVKGGRVIVRLADRSTLDYVFPTPVDQVGILAFWGGSGKDSAAGKLAAAFKRADVLDADPEYLRLSHVVAKPDWPVGRNRLPVPARELTEQQASPIIRFWRAQLIPGRDLAALPEGVVITGGRHSRIIDRGGRLDFCGRVRPTAIDAAIQKARCHFGGAAMRAWGSASFKDELWLAAKRAGIELLEHEPSPDAELAWLEEEAEIDADRSAERALTAELEAAAKIQAFISGERRQPPAPYGDALREMDEDEVKALGKLDPIDLAIQLPQLRRMAEEAAARKAAAKTSTSRRSQK